MRRVCFFGLLFAFVAVAGSAIAQQTRSRPEHLRGAGLHTPQAAAKAQRRQLVDRTQREDEATVFVGAISPEAVRGRPGAEILLALELAKRVTPPGVSESPADRDVAVAAAAAHLLEHRHPALRLIRVDDQGDFWLINHIPIARDVNPLLAARFFSHPIAVGGVRALSFLDESGGSVAHRALKEAMGDRFETYQRGTSLDEVMQFPNIGSANGARVVMVVGHIEGRDIVTRRYDSDGRPQEELFRISLASIEAAATRAGVYVLVAGCKAGEKGMTGPTVNIFASQEPVQWGRRLVSSGTLATFFRSIAPTGGFAIGNAGTPAVDQLRMLIGGVSEYMVVMREAVETAEPVRIADQLTSSPPAAPNPDVGTSIWYVVPYVAIFLILGSGIWGVLTDHGREATPPPPMLDQQTQNTIDSKLKLKMINLSVGEIDELRRSVDKDNSMIERLAINYGVPPVILRNSLRRALSEEQRGRMPKRQAPDGGNEPDANFSSSDQEIKAKIDDILKHKIEKLSMAEIDEWQKSLSKDNSMTTRMARSYGMPQEVLQYHLRHALSKELHSRNSARHG